MQRLSSIRLADASIIFQWDKQMHQLSSSETNRCINYLQWVSQMHQLSSVRLTGEPALFSRGSQMNQISLERLTVEVLLFNEAHRWTRSLQCSYTELTDEPVLQCGNLMNQFTSVKLINELVLQTLRPTDEAVLQSSSQKEPVVLNPVHNEPIAFIWGYQMNQYT